MFITRFQLNPQRRGAQRMISSPQTLHAAVLAGFPDPSPNDEGRVLWRLDAGAGRTDLYVVSPARPDFVHLVEQAGWPSLPTWESRDYRVLLDQLADGQRYAFRLTANPVRSKRDEAGGRGKIRGHVTVSQQEDWLRARQERHGFDTGPADPENATLMVTRRQTRTFSRGDARVTLRTATFEGTLTVTNAARFGAALTHGIGRAKGYGCGLLTIAAIR